MGMFVSAEYLRMIGGLLTDAVIVCFELVQI